MRSAVYRPVNNFQDIENILRSIDQLLQRKIQRVIAVPRDGDGEDGDIVTFYDTRFVDSRRLYVKIANTWPRIPLYTNMMILSGQDNTERTTTSTTNVSLSTVTVSIPFDRPIMVMANIRKTTGAANTASFGLQLNTTAVVSNTSVLGSANEAVSGLLQFWIGPRVANHLRAVKGECFAGNGTVTNLTAGSDAPTATITSVIVTALVGNAAITAACDEVKVYALPIT